MRPSTTQQRTTGRPRPSGPVASTQSRSPYEHPGTGTSCITFDAFLYPTQVLVVVPVREQPVYLRRCRRVRRRHRSVHWRRRGSTRVARASAPSACSATVDARHPERQPHGHRRQPVVQRQRRHQGPNGYAGSLEGYVTGEDGDPGSATVATPTSPGRVKSNGNEVPGRRRADRSAEDRRPTGGGRAALRHAEHLGRQDGTPARTGPGIYGEYKDTRSRRSASCSPGLYVFTGDFELAGQCRTAVGRGCDLLLHLRRRGPCPEPCDDPGEEGGGIKIAGTAGTCSTAPPEVNVPDGRTRELYGYALVYDRYNTR